MNRPYLPMGSRRCRRRLQAWVETRPAGPERNTRSPPTAAADPKLHQSAHAAWPEYDTQLRTFKHSERFLPHAATT